MGYYASFYTRGGGIYKLFLMPFTAQLTIPFFMTITGFTYASSYDRCGRWWSSSNLKRKWKRILIPVIPVLLFELLVCGMPDNPIIWLLSGGYQMPGSYYVILLIQLLFLFPVIKRFAHIYAGTSNSGAHTWWTGFIMVFIFQCAYELVTYVISLDVAIYRLLVFRYIIFIYGGAMIYEYHKVSPDMIPYKGMFKGLPIGLLFITAAGYLGFMPSVLFRYPTWYKSSAPTAFYIVPITAYGICHADQIEELLKCNVVTKKLGQLLGFWGKASYHIYFMQMLWFGLAASSDTNFLGKLIRFGVSLPVSLTAGAVFYLIQKKLEQSFSVQQRRTS